MCHVTLHARVTLFDKVSYDLKLFVYSLPAYPRPHEDSRHLSLSKRRGSHCKSPQSHIHGLEALLAHAPADLWQNIIFVGTKDDRADEEDRCFF